MVKNSNSKKPKNYTITNDDRGNRPMKLKLSKKPTRKGK